MNVTAKDKGTGKEQSITIQNSGNMSKEDIEKAQAEAEAHAEEDKKKREAIDAKNHLENEIYQAEKMPDEFKDKLSEDDVKTIKDAVAEAKQALADSSSDKEKLESAAKALSDVRMSIGAKMYQSASTEGPATESTDDTKSDDGEAVEGEVVDKE